MWLEVSSLSLQATALLDLLGKVDLGWVELWLGLASRFSLLVDFGRALDVLELALVLPIVVL